mmetsp:Transcript_69930/g.152560  ORF Transcript_69930/g.152560 Transcript_69930/m.152560 type:complete len:247 (+) Transcript_69930:534-1274(+)
MSYPSFLTAGVRTSNNNNNSSNNNARLYLMERHTRANARPDLPPCRDPGPKSQKMQVYLVPRLTRGTKMGPTPSQARERGANRTIQRRPPVGRVVGTSRPTEILLRHLLHLLGAGLPGISRLLPPLLAARLVGTSRQTLLLLLLPAARMVGTSSQMRTLLVARLVGTGSLPQIQAGRAAAKTRKQGRRSRNPTCQALLGQRSDSHCPTPPRPTSTAGCPLVDLSSIQAMIRNLERLLVASTNASTP